MASLTGSGTTRPRTHTAAVSAAMSRLRFAVLLSCWLLGVSLLTQTVIASLCHFTDMRWSTLVPGEQAPVVVTDAPVQSGPRSAFDEPAPEADPEKVVDPNRVLGRHDRVFSIAGTLTSGIGKISVMLVLPLMALAVLLAAGSATNGVEKAVAAFSWALLVGLLVMPIGKLIGLPWTEGALWSYASMIAVIDPGVSMQGLGEQMFVLRFLLLPLACVAGIALAAVRFGSGVEESLVPPEDLALDSLLETEAGNIKVSSLHGGRAASAMNAVGAVPTGTPVPGSPAVPPTPITPASAKEPPPPARLI